MTDAGSLWYWRIDGRNTKRGQHHSNTCFTHRLGDSLYIEATLFGKMLELILRGAMFIDIWTSTQRV
jgi:hypothetical protein